VFIRLNDSSARLKRKVLVGFTLYNVQAQNLNHANNQKGGKRIKASSKSGEGYSVADRRLEKSNKRSQTRRA